jgi:hypothetical protein
MKKLSKKELELISQATFLKCAHIGLKHAKENLPYIKNTLFDLNDKRGNIDSAIVVSAGPSLHMRNTAKAILESKFKGAIISADGALYYCLRNGLIPDYVLTVDSHPTRIIRAFGDPDLREPPHDNYFRRQDLDPALNRNEIERNKEIIELLNKYGRKIKLIISTSVTPKITKRCLDANMGLYWWNPIYDDYQKKNSITKRIYNLTRVPCMSTGGNVGTSAWVFASAVLGIKKIALVGMDLGYHPDTPLQRTQYYYELQEIFKDNVGDGFIKIYNPYLKEFWYTDPAYFWYRESFLELVQRTESKTYNCTEGGILFGKGIKFIRLKEFLEKFKK